EAAAVGQKHLASDRLVVVELARLRGRDIFVREHHDRALQRLGRVYVRDAIERDSPRRRVERRHSRQPKLALLSVAFQENALDLFQCVGVWIVGPKSQRALEPVGAGYAADAEHRCCNLIGIIAQPPSARPKSSFATRSSRTDAVSPCVSFTSTASGLFTSCCARN